MNVRKYFSTLAVILLIGFAAIGGYVFAMWMINGEPPAVIENITGKQLENKTVLVMGTDEGGLRSDVMILGVLNTKLNTVDLFSIPRDTMVKISGSTYKINSALALGGPEQSVETVENLLDVTIDNYVLMDFDGFKNIVDILGGVDFYVPEDMYYRDPEQDLYIDLEEGQQHLDGDKAEQLVRYRQYKMGDEDRVKVQQDFLKALFEQKVNASLVLKAPKLISEISKYIETDVDLGAIVDYASLATKLSVENFHAQTLPGAAQRINGLSYFIVETEEAQALVSEAINRTELPSPVSSRC